MACRGAAQAEARGRHRGARRIDELQRCGREERRAEQRDEEGTEQHESAKLTHRPCASAISRTLRFASNGLGLALDVHSPSHLRQSRRGRLITRPGQRPGTDAAPVPPTNPWRISPCMPQPPPSGGVSISPPSWPSSTIPRSPRRACSPSTAVAGSSAEDRMKRRRGSSHARGRLRAATSARRRPATGWRSTATASSPSCSNGAGPSCAVPRARAFASQVLVANVDLVLVVEPLPDPNVRRCERIVALGAAGGVPGGARADEGRPRSVGERRRRGDGRGDSASRTARGERPRRGLGRAASWRCWHRRRRPSCSVRRAPASRRSSMRCWATSARRSGAVSEHDGPRASHDGHARPA